MPTTERRTRRIDERLPRTGQGTLISLDTETVPPAVPTPQQVTGLAVVSTFLAYTSIAPQAVANLRWQPIAAPEPESYLVQWALDSGFTDPTTIPTARAQTTAAIDGLPPGGTVYFRVAAVWRSAQGAWSASVNSTMPSDTTPPAAPTSPAGNWSPVTGDLTLTWTNPTSANFKDVEVRIYDNSGGTLRRTAYSTTGRYVYTLAQNNQDTTNNPDPSLYIDFRARNYNNVYSATSATLTTTLSAPDNVSMVAGSPSTDGSTGAATWRWSTATGANFYRLTIDGIARDVYSTTYTYSVQQNASEHSGSATPTLPWSIVAVNALSQVSASATSGTASFTLPGTPGSLATDFTSPDLVVTWAASTTNTAGYRVQFNGATARDIGFTNTFTYTLAQNAADNGTPPDPTVDVSVWGVDAFARISTTPATASAVSPLPIAPTAVTLNGFFSTLTGSWTHSPTRTFRRYRCRLTRGGVDLVTAFTTVQFFTASVTSSGEYQLWVYTEDVFGRISSEANSGTTTLVSLSIDELRANAIYSDSVGNIVTTLDALKDNNTTSGGVTYNSSATYRWTEMARSLEDRYKTLTIGRFSVTSGTTFYVRTFDGTNIKWFAGSGSGNVNITGDVATLTNYANEGLAATNAINVNTYPTRTRWELPTIEESVNIRLYHRNTGSNYVLYEFYPRRLVQSDDIQAESILAINIAAGTITADQIAAGTITAAQIAAGTITAAQIAAGTITGNEISSATTITAGSGDEIAVLNGGASGILTDGTSELADADGVPIVEETFRIYAGNAIAANAPFRVDQFGNLTATSANISGNITAGSSSVITGGTIQTSASGARVVMNAGGLETYSSSNVLQISATTANDGELRAGAGAIRLNNSGMRLVGNTNTGSNRIFFYDNSNTVLLGSISAAYSAPSETLYVGSEGTLSISSIDDTYIIANSQKVGIGTLFPDANSYLSVGGSVNISSGSFYRVNGTQVVGARITGWSAPTGTASRGAFDTGIVTLGALAQRVKALIDDLTTHGLIGPTPP